MKKLLLLCILSVAISPSCFADDTVRQVTTFTPLPNQYSNYGYTVDPNVGYPRVTQIESAIFKRTFQNEDISRRLDRIESKLFNHTNSAMDLSSRVDLISQNINPATLANIPLNNIARIERKLFGRSYDGEDPEARISRIEKEMLGATQSGSLEQRFMTIATAAKNYNAFPSTTNPLAQAGQVYNYNNSGGFKNALKTFFTGYANGTMTGYTPPIYDPSGYYNNYNNYAYQTASPYTTSYTNSPYTTSYQTTSPYYASQNPYMTNRFGSSGYGYNDYMKTNTGYYNYGKNIGSGSGVHVLYD